MRRSLQYYGAIAIVLFVNLLFLIKYLSRITPYYLPAALSLTAICAIFWYYRLVLNQWLEK